MDIIKQGFIFSFCPALWVKWNWFNTVSCSCDNGVLSWFQTVSTTERLWPCIILHSLEVRVKWCLLQNFRPTYLFCRWNVSTHHSAYVKKMQGYQNYFLVKVVGAFQGVLGDLHCASHLNVTGYGRREKNVTLKCFLFSWWVVLVMAVGIELLHTTSHQLWCTWSTSSCSSPWSSWLVFGLLSRSSAGKSPLPWINHEKYKPWDYKTDFGKTWIHQNQDLSF